MAVSGFLGQMFFTEGLGGFSESWANTTAADLNTAQQMVAQLTKERMKIMGYGVRLRGARATLLPRAQVSRLVDVAGTNVAKQDLLVDPFTAPGAGSPTWDNADVITTDIVVRYFNNASRHSKIAHHAGVPDAIVVTNPDGPVVPANGAWFAAWQLWVQYLKNNNWGWIGRIDTPRVPILGFGTANLSGLGDTTITTASSGTLFALNDLVLVSGMRMRQRGLNTLNSGGPFQIIAVDTTVTGVVTYTLACSEGIQATQVCRRGTIRKYDLTVYKVDDAQILRQGSHRRGRPFGLSLGRRPTRGCRC